MSCAFSFVCHPERNDTVPVPLFRPRAPDLLGKSGETAFADDIALLDSMVIYLVMCSAVDVAIAIQKSMRETHIDRADVVQAFPLFIS